MTESAASSTSPICTRGITGRPTATRSAAPDADLAEEVASEEFLITWRRLTDVPVPALPWLLAVTRKVVIDQFRVAARRHSVAELEAWTFEARATAADVADQVAERLVVLTALAQLSEASSR